MNFGPDDQTERSEMKNPFRIFRIYFVFVGVAQGRGVQPFRTGGIRHERVIDAK